VGGQIPGTCVKKAAGGYPRKRNGRTRFSAGILWSAKANAVRFSSWWKGIVMSGDGHVEKPDPRIEARRAARGSGFCPRAFHGVARLAVALVARGLYLSLPTAGAVQ